MILLFCLLRVKIAPGAVVCLECELKGDINIGKVLKLWRTSCMLVLYIVLIFFLVTLCLTGYLL